MSNRMKNLLVAAVAVVVAFGIGAAWQFNEANRARAQLSEVQTQLDATRLDLELERIEATLAMATIATQMGNFERARQLTSEFYTALQEQTAAAPESAQGEFREMLRARDETITLLSRAQPEAGLQMARILLQYRQALGRDAGGLTPAGAVTPPDTMGG